MFFEIFLLLLTCLLIWYFKTRLPSTYPATPPIRLPLIGHGLYLLGFENSQEAFSYICEKYGKDGIVALHFGPIRWVFLDDFNLVKESYKREEINYRWRSELIHKLMAEQRGGNGKQGIIFSYERTWQEQRRFTLRTLREFGFGKDGMEDIINHEVEEFSNFLFEETQKLDSCIEMHNVYNISILNALWRIISGKRYDYRDPQLIDLTRKVNEAMLEAGPRFRLIYLLPWLRRFKIFNSFEDNQARFKSINEHVDTFNAAELRDFIDVYIDEMRNEKDPESSFFGENGLENLVQSLVDLFFAGSETTSSTLCWATLFLIRHPDVQAKMREEILRVIGKERQPRLSDKSLMPFTEAAIIEIQRVGNIAPFGLPHSTFHEDIKIGNRIIPKGHTIQVNMAGIMKSERAGWGPDAKLFRPERHLDSDGKVLHSEKFIPFLIGKRQCPGDSLAKAEIFLYLVGLLRRFEFHALDPTNPPGLGFINGVTSVPKQFKTRITPVK